MTRKKSNVKALALAVTCAILAGGYSGLNPVYAAEAVNYDVSTKKITAGTEIKELVINGVHIGTNTTSGTSAAEEGRIEAKNIRVGQYLHVGTQLETSTIVGNGTNGGIVNINGVEFVNDGAHGAITASSLSLDTIGDVTTAINSKAAKADVNTNKAAIQILEGQTTNISYDTSTNTTTVNGIKFHTDTGSGISDINDGIIKFSKNGTKDIVQINSDLMFNDDATGQAATLTLEGVKTLNGLSNGDSKIEADDGSVVGGVTFDNKNITNINNATVDNILKVKTIQSIDGNNEITVEEMATTKSNTAKITYEGGATYINQGDDQQVVIDDKGLKVGKNSSRMNDITGFATSKNLYVGTADADNPTKDNSKFYVDGATGETVVKGSAGTTTIYDGAITIDEPITPGTPSESIQLSKGTVLASASVISPKFFVDPNNAFEKNSLKVGDGTKGVTIANGEITTTGDATVGGNLSVAGTSTFTGKTTFSGGINTDTIDEATADKGVTVDGVLLKDKGIDAADGKFTVDGVTGDTTVGGKLDVTGNITGADITASGALKGSSLNVTNDAAVGGKLDVTGNATVGGDLAVAKNIKGQSLNIGATGNEFTVDTVGHMTSKSAQIGLVGINNTGVITGVTSLTTDALHVTGAFTTGGNLTVTGDLNATGAIKGKTISISDGGSIAGVSFATGGNLTATTGTIAGVSFAAGGDVSGVHDLTASGTIQGATLKVNDNNLLDNNGLKAEKAVIDSVVIDDASITSTGAKGLDVEKVNLKNGAITADKATIGGVNTLDNTGIKVATGSTIQVGVNTKIEDGSIAVSTNTKLTDQALNLNATNKWTAAGGLEADKATVNGVVLGADATQGKATFTDAAGKVTTIAGDTITTGTITAGELLVDSISLGKDPTNKNITIGSNGDIKTNGDITVTGTGGDTTVIDGAQATFGNDAMNQTIINKGDISVTAKNAADAQQSTLTHNNKGFKVEGKDASGTKASSFGFDTSTGIGTFTGQDGTTTAINGSSITSTNGAAAGVLNGSNLTLNDGTNSTALTAGGATFTGDAGEKGGKVTTINGGTITTDTLNVDRINLGGEVIDKGAAGVEDKSKLYMDAKGNLRAAGGNFKVTGADGAMTNTVGKTTLQTNNAGASMSYAGTVTSNVSVGNNNANVSAGAGSIDVTNESITSKVTDNASSTITKDSIVDKVGGTTVETKDGSFSVKGNVGNGMHIDTNTGETTFTGAAGEKGGTTTTINGGNITTDTLNVERINLGGEVIDKGAAGVEDKSKLYMDAKGNLRAAGGNFKVTGADGAMTNTVGKTSFATSDDGVNSSVTQGAEHKSEFKQGLTSIGGVVTNGTVKIEQTLDGDNGNITNEVTDKDGKSSKLVQNGTGLEYTDSAKADNATRINSSDVSIGSATDDSKRINLSDLGQIDDLDSEIQSRDEYKNNQTAVGAINAEAGIRREEVARLDNRIDDVNNRVDKVGAMAAAIASLKSIGYDPQAPSEFSIGLGQYKGETGVAMGFFHYPNKNFMINVSLSTAGGETMGGIGATWRFGHKSPQKLLEEQREAQAKKELAAAEKYQAAAKLAKEAQERAEYAAKLARQAQVSADNAKAAADATQAKHFQ